MADLVFIGSGFGVVMGVLAALWAICAAVGLVFKKVEAAGAGKTIPVPPGAPTPESAEGTPPAHVAAIAAAVAAMPGEWRVVRVMAPPHVAKVWAGQGRLEQQAGRRTRTTWAAPGHRLAARQANTPSDEGSKP